MKNIFLESQRERDIELSKFCGRPVAEIEKLTIGSSKSIQISINKDLVSSSYDHLYADYKYLDSVDYIRTLAYYTVSRRAKYINAALPVISTLFGSSKLNVLDYGCGVGSHGIYFLQKNNSVTFLDVDGPLFEYTKFRLKDRNLTSYKLLHSGDGLPKNTYDVVLCLDVLEHVANPAKKFAEIVRSMKKKSVLILEVSTMIKPTSGHFSAAINDWLKNGIPILKKNFKKLTNTLFVRL